MRRVLMIFACAAMLTVPGGGAAETSDVHACLPAGELLAASGETPCDPLPILLAQGEPPMDSNARPRMLHRDGPKGPGGGEMRKYIEQLRMLKMLEFLDLSEDQEMTFLTRFKSLRADEDRLEAERKAQVEKLSELVTSEDPNDEAIRAAVDSVRIKMKQRIALFEAFVDDVGELLTPAQLGKLVIFQDRFEYELLERVRSFQDRRGAKGGAGNSMERP